jgi:hypothetical protein
MQGVSDRPDLLAAGVEEWDRHRLGRPVVSQDRRDRVDDGLHPHRVCVVKGAGLAVTLILRKNAGGDSVLFVTSLIA